MSSIVKTAEFCDGRTFKAGQPVTFNSRGAEGMGVVIDCVRTKRDGTRIRIDVHFMTLCPDTYHGPGDPWYNQARRLRERGVYGGEIQ